MENVSCLYADFAYKRAGSKADFMDDIKFERYKIMLQTQKE
jgi:hypothetical protein